MILNTMRKVAFSFGCTSLGFRCSKPLLSGVPSDEKRHHGLPLGHLGVGGKRNPDHESWSFKLSRSQRAQGCLLTIGGVLLLLNGALRPPP